MKTETKPAEPTPTVSPEKPLFGYTSEAELFAAFNRRKKATQKRIKG